MNKRQFFYYIGIIMLVSALLMIAHNNARRLLSYQYLWGPFFMLALLNLKPGVYTDKKLILILSGGILFFGFFQGFIWPYMSDWYKNSLFSDFRSMLYGVTFYVLLRKYNYLREWIVLARLSLFFILITGLMTIIATIINPLIVRASYSSNREFIEGYDLIVRLGIGSYGYMTMLVALLPILVFFAKETKNFWLSGRTSLLIIIFLFFVIIRSQVFANILIGGIVLIFSSIGSKRFTRTIIAITSLTVVLILIPTETWIKLLDITSNLFDVESELHYKLSDTALFIENPELEGSTGAGSRGQRYPELLKAFIEKPFWGDASYQSSFEREMELGGHLYWMSRLTLLGIWGFLCYIAVLFVVFKSIMTAFDKNFKFYYFLSILSVILLGFIKNLVWLEVWLLYLIVTPGLYISYKCKLQKLRGCNIKM